MKGVILTNAYKDIPQTRSQCARLKEELEKLHVSIDIMRNDFFAANITSGGDIASKLSGYDFCIYLDKDKYISYMLEKEGIRLFNSARAIELCDDKMTTAICLSGSGIPMPETLPGLLCYTPGEAVPEESFRDYSDVAIMGRTLGLHMAVLSQEEVTITAQWNDSQGNPHQGVYDGMLSLKETA